MSVMQAAMDAEVDGIIGACGGHCSCGTCYVYVDERWLAKLPPLSRDEDDKLDEVAAPVKTNSRMACRISVTLRLDGMIVRIPATQG